MIAVRFARLGVLTFLLPSCLAAQDADLKAARTLERALERVIAKTEPSVACILVARTELYRKFGQNPADVSQGKLGNFDPATLQRLGIKKTDRDVLSEKLDMAHPRHVPESFGSGVVIDPKGLILTNFHVVRDATKVFVRLPGGKASYADIHAADARSDLAVLRLLKVGAPLPVPTLGDAGKLKRGQFLLTLTNPFAAGFRDGQPSASWGILSNVRRRSLGMRKEEDLARTLHQYGTLLQTDARLNLGSSGGALLDLEGNLVGLTTSWAGVHGGETPGGFAIPIDERFRRIVEVLRKGEEIEYGFLGVGLAERNFDDEPGVTVGQVYPGSPAQRDARLAEGDRILAVNGDPVNDSDDLFLFLGAQLAGATVTLDFHRPGLGKRSAKATLAKFWSPGPKIFSSYGARPFVRGMRVDDASILVQQLPRWPMIPPGVVVADVTRDSAAHLAGLKAGDVVLRVGAQPILAPAEFYRLMATQKGAVALTIWDATREGPGPTVTVK